MTTACAPPVTSIEVLFCGGASQVPSAEWDCLARRGFHLHHWCSAAERCGWEPRHVGVRAAFGYRAIVPAYLTGRSTLHDLHDRWLGPLSEPASRVGLELRPALSVQAPFGQISEPLGDFSGLPDRVVHQVFEKLEQTAELEGAKAVVWPFVDSSCRRLLEIGRERGYAVHYAGAAARLPIRWSSFDEYIATRSKSVRRTIKSDLETMRSNGLRANFLSDFGHVAAAMDDRYRQAFRRRNGREASLSPDFVAELATRPTPGIQALVTMSDDRLVGTSFNLMGPDLLDGTLAGFAPEYHAGPVYYNDLCYSPIKLAIRERIAAIDLGPTALYAKVLRGAVLRRRMVLVRGTNRARHRLLSVLGALVGQRAEYKERRALGRLWGARCYSQEDESP
jgi:predicted N-acyltransferase